MNSHDSIDLALVPGLLCGPELWAEQVSGLSDIARPKVVDVTYQDSIPRMAESVLESMPARFALAGLSMGGYVALEIMRQAPARISHLALLDTVAHADTAQHRGRRRELIELSSTGRLNAVVDALLPMFVHRARLGEQELIDRIRRMATTVGADAHHRQQLAITQREDSQPLLAAIDCPTLVLCGREDQLTPLPQSELIAARIPGAELVVVEDCGHLATMERPEAVTAAMRRWLLR